MSAGRAGGRRGAGALALGLAALGAAPARAAGEGPATTVIVERTAVRFVAPETGGAEQPRFVLERILAFEARLEALAESGQGGPVTGTQERDVRSAMEHDVAEQILVSLGQKLIDDSPADKRPVPAEIEGVITRIASARLERLGGRARVDEAAAAEQVSPSEVDALLRRSGFAAWYLDRALAPILHPSEEQLRDVYRSNNPYRGQPFDQVKAALERWFIVDRVRVAEAAFLQAARSHVKIVITR